MKQIRYILWILLAIIGLSLWNTWQKDHPVSQTPEVSRPTEATTAPSQVSSDNQSVGAELQPIGLPTSQVGKIPKDRIIHISTDVLNVNIDMLGGKIIRITLPKYSETLKSDIPVSLLNTQPDTFYIAESGLQKYKHNHTNMNEVLQYKSDKNKFALGKNQDQLSITLTARTSDGLKVVKTYVFKKGQYNFSVNYAVKNESGKTWAGNHYMRLLKNSQVAKRKSLFVLHLEKNVSFSTNEKSYTKIKFSKLKEESLNQTGHGGWLAMPDHYFIGAWVPESKQSYHYYTQFDHSDILTAGILGPQLTIEPGETVHFNSTFYGGPKIEDNLDAVAPHLSMTINYGWLLLWPISITLFKILKYINGILGNWGWSIITLTILIKLIFYKLSATSYRSMAGMRKLQPKIKNLKDKYANDKQGLSKATMELYKKEKINPLGGCLPILVQIPVFLALYWVLLSSVELRQTPFILWIHDLSAKDPYYVLPVLMGISMYIQQKLSPQAPDPTQAKMMMFLPIVMTAFFLNFPAGLVLYWLVNNILSVLQQWYVMRQYETKKPRKKAKKRR